MANAITGSPPKSASIGTQKLYVETYGCQMNEYDSGLVRSILGDQGYESVPRPEDAGVILINTCAIREKAHEKVYNRLHALGHLKRRDNRVVVGVLGCMAQNLGDDLFAQGIAVDFVLGPDNYRELPRLIQRVRGGREGHINLTQLSRTETYEELEPEVVSGCQAFVTIMRGCDNFCSFCVVPYTRGRERSRSPGSIVREVQRLITERRVREVTLLGQNVNSYQHAGTDFTGLIEMLLGETDIQRIRFTSPHPHDFPLALLKLMAREERFCSQIHLPMQSGSSSTLQRMKRDYDRAEFMQLLDIIRETIPDVGISTDVIVGFSGESEAEFAETLSLMEYARFDMAFMFRYSEREHTSASKSYPDDVPEEVKIRRLEELIALQNRIMLNRNRECVGRVFPVMIEGRSRRSAQHWMGRSASGKVIIFPWQVLHTHNISNGPDETASPGNPTNSMPTGTRPPERKDATDLEFD
ncbi:MAG: tRNA (N6-isopentenyl adenosine(37)-C2)-methylthiotransferase MiaB, partial [Leptospiraceae bacterium]|nr:tRNA (N6-isopentenyl adenosine(37)-C2)-methylthiotransferase MiaB [Leptospiraceae bacterium]